MKNKQAIFLLFLCCLGSMTSWSQENNKRRKEAETFNALLAIQVGIPSKEMQAAIKNNMGNLGFGAGVSILTNPFTWDAKKETALYE